LFFFSAAVVFVVVAAVAVVVADDDDEVSRRIQAGANFQNFLCGSAVGEHLYIVSQKTRHQSLIGPT